MTDAEPVGTPDTPEVRAPGPARSWWPPHGRSPHARSHPRIRRALLTVAVVVAALVGGGVGLLLGGATGAEIGPVDTRMSLRPVLEGGTTVEIPPLGSLSLDSHDGPFGLQVQVSGLDIDDTATLFRVPGSLEGLENRLAADVRAGVIRAAVRGSAAATLGAAVLGLLAFRRVRLAVVCGGTAFAVVVVGGAVAAATWDPDSVAEPEFEGLLASAPALVGDAADIVDNFDLYRAQLAKLVTNVSTLYAAGTALPAFTPAEDSVRILHVSDIHLNPAAWNVIRSVSEQFQVDAVVDTGDLTDHGSTYEASFANGIATISKPYLFVRGNHDSAGTQLAVSQQPNAIVMDEGRVEEVAGLRFIGWGDPRFTPDKETRDMDPADAVTQTGERLAEAVRASDPPGPHVALVHDPATAEPLDGLVPLALAGHGHRRETYLLDGGTRIFEQGSTGAAGLRGLEHEEPTPLQLSVLYFDRTTGTLQAWDDITLGGLGLASANIERHLPDEEERSPITPAPETPAPETPAPPTAAPSGGAVDD